MEHQQERVIFKNNPLHEVICQLRFPELLQIKANEPVAFQNALRKPSVTGRVFSGYAERSTGVVGVPEDIISSMPPIIAGAVKHVVTHDFSTQGKDPKDIWTVSLNPTFVALRAGSYKKWEDYFAELDRMISVFQQEYQPSFYSRVGLRYINYIRPSHLPEELRGPWPRLLKTELLGELANKAIEGIGTVEGGFRRTLIELMDSEGIALLQHGVADIDGEQVYVIDSDFYCENQTEVADVRDKLCKFNEKAGGLFRWCISDSLYKALGPIPVDTNSAKSA